MRHLCMLCCFMGVVMTAAAAVPLVEDGQAAATLVLPAETEFDRFVNRSAEEIDAFIRQRSPNAPDEQMVALRKEYAKWAAREAKRVGDEEELAVEELQEIIRKISGAELPILRLEAGAALPDGPAILLGAELATQAGLADSLAQLVGDGILLTTQGDKIVLAGRHARGTLYAAYDFLESLGCRWVMPGEFGEIYPSSTTLVSSVDKLENPSHSQRYWWNTYGQGEEFPRWSLRNKGDMVKALGAPTVAQGHALALPLTWGARSLPEEESKTITVKQWQVVQNAEGERERKQVDVELRVLNDDYYAQVNGRPNRHNPNFSNPRVWKLYSDYYKYVFGTHRPFDQYVSISAEDGLVLDEHPASRELDSFEYDPFMGAYSATDRLWFFHNRVIEEVVKEFPDRKFGVLVYSNNMTPPRIEQVHPNMALVFAPLGISPLHHVRDPRSKTNREYRKWLEAWMRQARAAGAETYYYDYDPIGFQWNHLMICPQWAIIGKNYPWFHELGLDGHTTQGHDDWASSGMNHWLMIRLYWNIDQNYRDVLRDYCQIRFGAAADDVMAYFDVYEKRMEEIPDIVSNEIWGNHLILTPDVRAAARNALAPARNRQLSDREKAHLQTLFAIQDATDAFCDGIEFARETGDYGKAAELLEPAFAIRDNLNQLYSHFVQPQRTDKSRKTEYLSGGWYNKYLIWNRRISGAAASMVLPRYWHGGLDTDNVAAASGWHNPGADTAVMEEIDTTLIPDVTYQTQREVAAFFYRTEVDVPVDFANREKIELYFPSIIARAVQIWINGKPVRFDHGDYRDSVWRGPKYFWYDYDHQQRFDVTTHIEPGKKNTIAFRVFKSFDHGGSYDRIWLLADAADDQETEN